MLPLNDDRMLFADILPLMKELTEGRFMPQQSIMMTRTLYALVQIYDMWTRAGHGMK